MADRSATFESLGKLLSSHRAIARVSLAALSFTILVAVSQQAAPPIQAGPERPPLIPESILPQTVGILVGSDDPVTVSFAAAMNPASVEANFQLVPTQKFDLAWNADNTALAVRPDGRWRTDEHYVMVIGTDASQADGRQLSSARRYSFTTETAPAVSDFQVRLASGAGSGSDEVIEEISDSALARDPVTSTEGPGEQPPSETATEVSASSSITISFSEPMDRGDAERHFAIAPSAKGELRWTDAGDLVFEPADRLKPGSRYTISLIGAHDQDGNRLGGKANFSFVVQDGAQVTKTQPEDEASDVEPVTVEIWFSQPMDVDAANEAFALKDTSSGGLVGGLLNWNDAGTQLIYTPDDPFAGGRIFEVAFADGAKDADGNKVSMAWSFETKAAPVAAAPPRTDATTRSAPAPAPPAAAAPPPPAPVVPAPAPATSLAGYALNQVNAARAAYGFAPVALDGSISAVASAHAWDQARNNYFSHYSLDGRSREDRLGAGGVGFGWSGENQCYHIGMSQQATLDWCHAQFMAEPYPGHWNHIANILNPNARRMGVGIATVGGKTVITWNFTD